MHELLRQSLSPPLRLAGNGFREKAQVETGYQVAPAIAVQEAEDGYERCVWENAFSGGRHRRGVGQVLVFCNVTNCSNTTATPVIYSI